MSKQSTETTEIRVKDDQTAALIAAQTFIAFSAIYWFTQLESVRELLELAYGRAAASSGRFFLKAKKGDKKGWALLRSAFFYLCILL